MGYLRRLEFLPDGKTVQVRTYSPALKQTLTSELEEFQFTLKLADAIPRSPKSHHSIRAGRNLHRYSFHETPRPGGGSPTRRATPTGCCPASRGSVLPGRPLVLRSNEARDGYVKLPSGVLDGLTDVSVEIWFTPTAEAYNWNSVWLWTSVEPAVISSGTPSGRLPSSG